MLRFKILVFYISCFVPFSVRALDLQQISAKRQKHESVEHALKRISPDFVKSNQQVPIFFAKPTEQLDSSFFPEWESLTQIQAAFFQMRDERFSEWFDASNKLFHRRLPWLFPDDGCYLRADLMKWKLKERGFPGVAKLFVFGDLRVDTPFHEDGKVRWMYHVALAVKVDEKIYIIDPALDFYEPMLFADWAAEMQDPDLKWSLCSADTFTPLDDCMHPHLYPIQTVNLYRDVYLNAEWERITSLNYDPYRILGDFPPWRSR